LNVPKVDCYFLYNSNWSDVTGSVLPETQLQFCASQASINKQTTLTGTKKSGTFSKTDFYLSKDDRACYGFDAPSSDGSYTFSVSANGEEACNSTPTLVVQAPQVDGYFDCIYSMGGSSIPSGTKTYLCRNNGSCSAVKLHCCKASNCNDGQSVSSWKINDVPQSTTIGPNSGIYSCSEGTTVKIESSGDLKCGVMNW
jgi:hypothetical protein